MAFICVYESMAQAFSSFGVEAGMLMYMFLVDQGNTFNGVYTPIDKTEWPFKIGSYITPARQMMASFTYLQYVGSCMSMRMGMHIHMHMRTRVLTPSSSA
jgi:hypothetical protein